VTRVGRGLGTKPEHELRQPNGCDEETGRKEQSSPTFDVQ